MTPGAYLKMRRCAAGKSVADVAAKIGTMPRIAEHMRAELIEFIEADATPASFDAIVAFNNVYPFDFDVLATLVRISMGGDLPAPQLCRICACSDFDRCVAATDFFGAHPCGWARPDLCTRCASLGTVA